MSHFRVRFCLFYFFLLLKGLINKVGGIRNPSFNQGVIPTFREDLRRQEKTEREHNWSQENEEQGLYTD